MKKTLFEEPEMEVVRFDARDAFIATSGGCNPDIEDQDTYDCGEDYDGCTEAYESDF